MSQTPDKFDLLTMADAYALWKSQNRMQGVITCFGGRQKHQPAAMPYVRWEPTQDTFTIGHRAQFDIQPRGAGGTNQLSGVVSKHLRAAGVSLYLCAKDDPDVEQLLARVVLALEDTFGAEANCRVLGGAWRLAEAQVEKAERYELRISISLPVVRILPAAPVAAVSITPSIEVP